jgi:hypothetical protein
MKPILASQLPKKQKMIVVNVKALEMYNRKPMFKQAITSLKDGEPTRRSDRGKCGNGWST